MAKIGFIGLGHMGLPMAQNLVKVGHAVAGFDLSEYPTERLAAGGGTRANSVADASQDAEIVITMLPAGDEVREVYFGDDGVLVAAPAGALMIDSTTIDIGTARDVAQAAEAKGLAMVDAPVSGGVAARGRPRLPSWSAARRPHSSAHGPCWKRWARLSSTPAGPAAARPLGSATT